MSEYIKYPRTRHVPWSPGCTNDDKIIVNMDAFVGQRVIITEKMDGENTSLYHDYYHARSIDSRNHPSRNWVKRFHSDMKWKMPSWLRLCGENMFAQHNIPYDNLEHYFLGFSVWDGDLCFNWDSTVDWFEHLGITHVPVIYDGIYEERILKDIEQSMNFEKQEGYVMRTAEQLYNIDFDKCVCKYVRKGHVQRDSEHWMSKPIIQNGLKQCQ